ncbi:IS66 family insertion sequence element accessory protein TnpB, partial [Bradyrhizobium sp. UFLA05-112]
MRRALLRPRWRAWHDISPQHLFAWRKAARAGLLSIPAEQLHHDPFAGTIFVFRSKRADRLKILA